MVSKKMTDLQPWECLMKRIVWKQLGDIRDKKILDFGSGIGVTANYLAEHNDVTAIEPDEDGKITSIHKLSEVLMNCADLLMSLLI